MSTALHGCRVLVTRPEQQAEPLCRLIESSGGIAIRLPTLIITESPELSRQALLERISIASHIIFISRNAVDYAARLAGYLALQLQAKTVIAVGEGTRHALAEYAVTNSVAPELGVGSESLLALSELDAIKIKGQTVLIVQGGSGRELLQDGLIDRGAIVHTANVYQRTEPVIEQRIIDDIWRRNCPDVIVATSFQGLQNLIRMTSAQDRTIMFSKKLVVISARLAGLAKTAGFTNPAHVPTEQSDQGLLQTIRHSVE